MLDGLLWLMVGFVGGANSGYAYALIRLVSSGQITVTKQERMYLAYFALFSFGLCLITGLNMIVQFSRMVAEIVALRG